MIELYSSNPNVPLPDPLWYQYVQEIFPDQPDEKLDIVETTQKAERLGLTLVDFILYNHGKSPVSVVPPCRQFPCRGMVLLVSAADRMVLGDTNEEVVCYEEGHPRDWVFLYPNHLWVTRFWFGHVWLYHLGVEHVVLDIPLLLNRAWLSPHARLVPLEVKGPLYEAHRRVPFLMIEMAKYLRREWGVGINGGVRSTQ